MTTKKMKKMDAGLAAVNRLAKAEQQRDELATAMRKMLEAYESLMPGLRYIAVQDYAILNEAPIAARKALAKLQP